MNHPVVAAGGNIVSEQPLENLRPLPLTVSLPLQYLTAVVQPLCNSRYILTVITVTYQPHQYGRLSAAPFNGRSLLQQTIYHTGLPYMTSAIGGGGGIPKKQTKGTRLFEF